MFIVNNLQIFVKINRKTNQHNWLEKSYQNLNWIQTS